ncbi:MAG: fused DSP-PTPase phosphatase/NAD kinase-like protein [Bdellovibrionota bacterium]
MQGRIFFATLVAVLLSPNANAENPIPNFVKAEDGLYRGGSPGDAGIAYLKSLGVKTILNLDDRAAENAAEKTAAAAAGIREISVPMSGFWAPKDRRVDRALAALENSKLRPIFVHCQHGQDRTGLVLGLYRVFSEHWQPGHAYEEMKSLGFHPILFLLNHYFEERTGWDD